MTEGNIANPESPAGECYRCGYDLRGIADDQPCPECGLLAGRSRRPTDELHNTRPRWLRSISAGSNLILLAIALAIISTLKVTPTIRFYSSRFFLQTLWNSPTFSGGLLAATLLLFCGVILLARSEGYAPADDADRHRRIWLRLLAITPSLVILPILIVIWMEPRFVIAFSRDGWMDFAFGSAWISGTLGLPLLALLLLLQLRSIARRARSSHLAEHCTIVGVGSAVSLLFISAGILVSENADHWFGPLWMLRSDVALGMVVGLAALACLFPLWALYLLIHFAIAFNRASRELRHKWTRDDRSTPAI